MTKIKRRDTFAITAPKENDMLILTLEGTYSKEGMERIDREVRKRYPEWKGLLVVLRPGQKIERVPEKMARAIYAGLRERFEAPPSAPDHPADAATEVPRDRP